MPVAYTSCRASPINTCKDMSDIIKRVLTSCSDLTDRSHCERRCPIHQRSQKSLDLVEGMGHYIAQDRNVQFRPRRDLELASSSRVEVELGAVSFNRSDQWVS